MGGVVFGGGTSGRVPPIPTLAGSGLSKFSERFDVAPGPLPPGQWWLTEPSQIAVGGAMVDMPAGSFVDSDGSNVMSGGGHGVMLGARRRPQWPWPRPWPLNLPGMWPS